MKTANSSNNQTHQTNVIRYQKIHNNLTQAIITVKLLLICNTIKSMPLLFSDVIVKNINAIIIFHVEKSASARKTTNFVINTVDVVRLVNVKTVLFV